jgi:hypothetical protein
MNTSSFTTLSITELNLQISFMNGIITMEGHAVAWWLRHCATNQKVTGLIPDEVNF